MKPIDTCNPILIKKRNITRRMSTLTIALLSLSACAKHADELPTS
jgi:hypothetical protein